MSAVDGKRTSFVLGGIFEVFAFLWFELFLAFFDFRIWCFVFAVFRLSFDFGDVFCFQNFETC